MFTARSSIRHTYSVLSKRVNAFYYTIQHARQTYRNCYFTTPEILVKFQWSHPQLDLHVPQVGLKLAVFDQYLGTAVGLLKKLDTRLSDRVVGLGSYYIEGKEEVVYQIIYQMVTLPLTLVNHQWPTMFANCGLLSYLWTGRDREFTLMQARPIMASTGPCKKITTRGVRGRLIGNHIEWRHYSVHHENFTRIVHVVCYTITGRLYSQNSLSLQFMGSHIKSAFPR